MSLNRKVESESFTWDNTRNAKKATSKHFLQDFPSSLLLHAVLKNDCRMCWNVKVWGAGQIIPGPILLPSEICASKLYPYGWSWLQDANPKTVLEFFGCKGSDKLNKQKKSPTPGSFSKPYETSLPWIPGFCYHLLPICNKSASCDLWVWMCSVSPS